MIMVTLFKREPWLTSVPAAAVIQGGLVLFFMIGRKGYIGGFLEMFCESLYLLYKSAKHSLKLEFIGDAGIFRVGGNPSILKGMLTAEAGIRVKLTL